jgi:hypothetical protein
VGSKWGPRHKVKQNPRNKRKNRAVEPIQNPAFMQVEPLKQRSPSH